MHLVLIFRFLQEGSLILTKLNRGSDSGGIDLESYVCDPRPDY